MLEHAGYRVSLAPNAEVALRLVAEGPFDLIITDIVMPDRGGVELIVQILAENPEAKIFAISGGGRAFGPDSLLDVAKSVGAVRTFLKPVGNKELVAAIQHQLGPTS